MGSFKLSFRIKLKQNWQKKNMNANYRGEDELWKKKTYL